MRISDWSSDVCSSDLARPLYRRQSRRVNETGQGTMPRVDFYRLTRDPIERVLPALATRILANGDRLLVVAASAMRRQAIDEALWTLHRASLDRKSTRLNSSHSCASRMPASA